LSTAELKWNNFTGSNILYILFTPDHFSLLVNDKFFYEVAQTLEWWVVCDDLQSYIND